VNQDRTPVVDAVERWARDADHAVGLPGHRDGAGAGAGAGQTALHARDTLAVDVIAAGDAVSEAEALYADATGAREAIFTTCGPAMNCVVLALLGPGQKLLTERNPHRAVATAMIIAGAEAVWLPPSCDRERGIVHPAPLHDVEDALRREQVSAVLLTSPTEHGAAADIAQIAEACHRRGVPLLVDETWGAHFAFHPGLPTAAVRAGADVVTQCLERAGGTLGQASVVLTGGDLVDPAPLRACLRPITSTSTSALVHCSIDGFRHRMAVQGTRLLDAALDRAEWLRTRLARTPGLTVLDKEITGPPGVAGWDPLKLVVDVSGLGITGYRARSWLREQGHLTVRTGDARHVVCALTYADDERDVERLASALEALAAEALAAEALAESARV
jgi:arginine decarboxylase